MLLKKVFRKNRLYRRFELDVWGFHLIYGDKRTRVSKLIFSLINKEKAFVFQRRMRYIYRIDQERPVRRRKPSRWEFITRKFARLFYLTLKYEQFKRSMKIAYKHSGSHEGNYIMLIENRLIFMMYRMQFCLNVFDLRRFIENIGVVINGECFKYCNLPVAFGSILTISVEWVKTIHYYLYKRMIKNQFYFNIPRYMFISYKLMFGLVYREPKTKDLIYPISQIDVFRASDFS